MEQELEEINILKNLSDKEFSDWFNHNHLADFIIKNNENTLSNKTNNIDDVVFKNAKSKKIFDYAWSRGKRFYESDVNKEFTQRAHIKERAYCLLRDMKKDSTISNDGLIRLYQEYQENSKLKYVKYKTFEQFMEEVRNWRKKVNERYEN